jgi:hypothetical protein
MKKREENPEMKRRAYGTTLALSVGAVVLSTSLRSEAGPLSDLLKDARVVRRVVDEVTSSRSSGRSESFGQYRGMTEQEARQKRQHDENMKNPVLRGAYTAGETVRAVERILRFGE